MKILFSWYKRKKGKEKKKKETSFKCEVYLVLRHTNWGHCKLKLTQIKSNQMYVGSLGEGKPKTALGKIKIAEQRREPTNVKLYMKYFIAY